MSVIGGLLMPQFKPYDLGGTLEQATRIAGGQTANQTALLTLADLKAKQASEQEYLLAIKNNPEIAKLILGGSTIASLPTMGGPGGPPAAGPLTQQTTVPGQPPGAPQMVPGGQDLSQFATQGAPGPPTLATLGPGQGATGGPPQAPQNPLLEMAARDPRAAMMLQQQLGQRQDLDMKRQEQRLKTGAATLEYVGQEALGVSDQAGLDAMRANLQSQGLNQYAAQLPQFYSKEAMAPFIAKATSVKESLTLQTNRLSAQADVLKARMAGRVAKTDQYLKALGVAPGQETASDMEKAIAWQQRDEIAVSAMHGAGQIKDTPAGAVRIRPSGDVEYLKGPQGEPILSKPTEQEQKAQTFGNLADSSHKTAVELENKGFQPSVWAKGLDTLPLGIGNYLTSNDYQKYRQAVSEFAQAWLYKTSGAQVTEDEWERTNQTYFPQPGESKEQIAFKRGRREEVIRNLREEGKATGRPGTQGQPQGQGSTGTGGQAGAKVVTRAALQAENARRNEANRAAGRPELSNEQAEAMARQKGYEVR